VGDNLRNWRLRQFRKHPYCYWCGRKLRLIDREKPGKQEDDEATVDHLRSRLDEIRTEPQPRHREWRRVLSCFKCNNERSALECTAKVEMQRSKSGSKIELWQRPYWERRKFLLELAERIERGGISGLIAVMGKLSEPKLRELHHLTSSFKVTELRRLELPRCR
jgi:hypothetical protein